MLLHQKARHQYRNRLIQLPSSANIDIGLGSTLSGTTTTKLKKSNTILLPIPEDINYTDNPKCRSMIGVKGRFGPQLPRVY